MNKPKLSFWQIWNMSFGFFGIQFGWGLQMANMSAIYKYLGASADQIPMLWLAAPLTGLIVQPIIGSMSDKTWNRFGRRRPYFLVGALLASTALIFMPNSSTLWMAAGLLWILDASINVSMEPFRAFVADMLPEQQRTRGFAMQSLFIGAGAVIASALPWIFTNLVGIKAGISAGNSVPTTVKFSFYLGALAFLGAVLWTIFRTKEYPPENMTAFRQKNSQTKGFYPFVTDIFKSVMEMPSTMRKLAWVQFFTWMGLFCMWLYFSLAVAKNVFHTTDEKSILFQQGNEWAGLCFSMYSLVCFGFSFLLPKLADRLGLKMTHIICLLAGALGLLSVSIIHDQYLLLLSMTGVGIAWASILSMPYAILSGSIPAEKTGVYMGIFNFFIVLPEIIVALGFGWIMKNVLNNNCILAVIIGGIFFIIAALMMQRVKEKI